MKIKLLCMIQPKVLVPVIVLGLLGHLFVDAYIRAIAEGLVFNGPLSGLEAPIRDLILDRGARAVWLWTYLPLQIAWLVVSRTVDSGLSLIR